MQSPRSQRPVRLFSCFPLWNPLVLRKTACGTLSSTRQFDLRKQRLVAERKQRGRSNGNTSLSTAANCFTSQHAPCTVQPCPDRVRLYPKNARGVVDACFLHVTHNEDGA